jgi:mannose-6-phosphate isomerase
MSIQSNQVGEIWFEPPADHALTSWSNTYSRPSGCRQVHPNDATAQARGYPRGKDECWIVLDADDDAELGIGTVREMSADEVIAAARDGSIVDLIDWRRPKKGDFIYNPAGTIHALGQGLTVLEIQQAVDLTYRLD